jgi:hypothetical protein
MYGIYILDLDSGHFYMSPAQSLQEIQEALQREQQSNHLPSESKWEGSYHFYPILSEETEPEAEKRVFLLLARQYGNTNIWPRYTFREVLARGTWSPGLRLAYISESVQSSATEKENVFSISI